MIEMRSSFGADPIVSVIVIHRGDSDAAYACVESVSRYSDLDFPLETILVENGVHELVPPRLGPGVFRVRMRGRDRGYAAAVNEGAACARAPFLLFLNPYAHLSRDDIAALVRAARLDGRLAGIAPILQAVDESGRVIRPSWTRRACMSLAAGSGQVRLADRTRRLVRWVPAVSLLVRTDVFRALRGFDEAFVDVGGDEDWCLRARRRGYAVALLPDVKASVSKRGMVRSQGRRERAVRARLRIVGRHASPLTASLYRRLAPTYLAATGLLDRIPRLTFVAASSFRARLGVRSLRLRLTKIASARS
jgi:GT2 family glycosyltransferase